MGNGTVHLSNAARPRGSSTHAHPTPSTSIPPGVELIRNLLYELDLGLQLCGLQGSDWYKLTDIYMPEVRRSPIERIYKRPVKHLDVVSCWKGLSHQQAKELTIWEYTFKTSLETTILDTVIRSFADYVRNENEALEKSTIVACLKRFISMNPSWRIDITVPDLISEMIEQFNEIDAHTTHTLFTSSCNLPSTLFNFVRMHDCFLDTYPRPSVEVTFSYDFGASLLLIGEVNWQPPMIYFYNLAEKLPIGAEYRIECNYIEPVLSQSFSTYPADQEFLVSSKMLPLVWDSNKRYFRVVVPVGLASTLSYTSEEDIGPYRGRLSFLKHNNQRLETVFTAKFVTHFPGEVRSERETRYGLFLEVEYEEVGANSVHSVPDTMNISSPSTVSVHLTPESFSECASSPKSTPYDEAEPAPASPSRISSWVPSYLATPASKVDEKREYDPSRDNTPVESPSTLCVGRGTKPRDGAHVTPGKEQWDEPADLVTRRRTAFSEVHQPLLGPSQPPPESSVSESKINTVAVEQEVKSITEVLKNNDAISKSENHGRGAQFPVDRSNIDLRKRESTEDLNTSIGTRFRASLQSISSDNDEPDQHKHSIPRLCIINQVKRQKAVTQARCHSWLEETNRNLGSKNLENFATCFKKFSPKRKASSQDPTIARHTNLFHNTQMGSVEQLGYGTIFAAGIHSSEELAAKRQRLSERIDSGIGMSGYYFETNGGTDGTDVDSNFGVSPQHMRKQNQDSDDDLLLRVANFTTGCLGEACTPCSSEDAERSSWFATLKGRHMNNAKETPKSRAYETGSGELKIMPALKKNGSVKRIVFQKRRTLNVLPLGQPTPCSSGPSPIDELPSPVVPQIYTSGAHIPSSMMTQRRRSPQTVLPEIEHSEEDLTEYIQRRQREIADNYDQALTQQMVKESRRSTTFGIDGTQDGDEKAMERIFLARSEGSGEVIDYGSGIEWESESEISELVGMGSSIDVVEHVE